ncbi:bifunctional diguanylate cyclase/phosphodiesterase [Kineosporia sp. J2-2]|uniref:Bifunctional diguanylate cyclase/phosphodiesterase n=1 Tax=Kineosporia corallincola TaxID=2835133 RepID=A0ABS5TA97_9ACTN|nr:bifunctional diguanylate cyclase/phosphodiesterase [Kineosporia corallincola]MBT0767990.1 bifunctional diguanylate cyclase/phosphodiesterase [Kineosporia corallincola]
MVPLLQTAMLLAVAVAVIPATPPDPRTALAVAVPCVLLCTALLLTGSARDAPATPAVSRAWWLLAASYAATAVAVAWWTTSGQDHDRLVLAVTTLGRIGQVGGVVLLLRGRSPRWARSDGLDPVVVVTGATALAVVALELTLANRTGTAGPPPSIAWLPLLVDVVLFVLAVTTMAATSRPLRSQLHRPAVGLLVVAVADLLSFRVSGVPALVSALDAGFGGPAWVGLLALAGHATVGWGAVATGPGRNRLARLTGTRELPSPLPGARGDAPAAIVVAGCAVLVAVSLVVPQAPRIGAGLALVCLVVAVFRTREVLRSDRRRSLGAMPRPHTDALTGLADRRALAEALADRSRGDSGAAGLPRSAGQGTGLLLVDLDNFKDVNEALGHDSGDRLLTAVGARLRTALLPGQMLARLGSDEFAVLLPGAGAARASTIAQSLQAALREPFDVGGSRLHVAASIGIATSPAPGAVPGAADGPPGDLLRRADVALHRAQRARSGQALYDPLGDDGSERLRRTGELRQALARGDIEVHVQPQVDLATGQVVGAEALARWRHPHDGVLLPAAFLPLAEHTGLARPMATLVLDRALEACASWWQAGHRVPVSVNLTADDLRDEELPGRIWAALHRQSLPAAALRVEITEQALLTDPEAAAGLLARWRKAGVSVSIDDFGTGYSSLSYLRQLPVDEVKLDRAFVADLARENTVTIVRHTIAMAHGLQARVVAEGIEDVPTARQLAGLGCDIGQGLVYGAAMTAPEFLARLRAAAPGHQRRN